jgi:uridine monophosphate synthetase
MSTSTQELSYAERAELSSNATAKRLLTTMSRKKSNLSVAIDVTDKATLLKLANEIGPEICLLKTHIDIIEDFDKDLTVQLQELAHKHDFLIFEDRKFADIGNTVKLQYEKGIYHISDWADIINAHTVPGPGIIEGLKQVGMSKGRGLLLLAEMSPKGTLAHGSYTEESVNMALQHPDFVIGFISRNKLTDDPRFIHMTPGVKLQGGGDALGQQYLTPRKVIAENVSDIIIVGRGIIEAASPRIEAQKYREESWKAYKERL